MRLNLSQNPEDIIGTIAGDNALLVIPQSHHRTKHVMEFLLDKLIEGKLIRIVYDEEEESIVVISAYGTTKVRKYLRR